MKVSTYDPFVIVYSLFQHEYLGYLIGSYVVQLNPKGELSLLNQIVSAQNIKEFSTGLNHVDFELIKSIEAIQQDTILKKFSPKKTSALDFFMRVYDPNKGDKVLQEAIAGYLENHKANILEKLAGKRIYIMGNNNDPTWKPVHWMPDRAKVYFNFVRNEENTHYFPIIKYNGERLNLRHYNTFLLCDDPAWLLIDDKLYHFDKHVEGKKLKPFLSKNHIVIPRNVEEQYYQRFVTPLIASYDVFAKGFQIVYETAEPKPLLQFSEVAASVVAPAMFQNDTLLAEEQDSNSQITFELSFQYGRFNFRFDSFASYANVSLEKQEDTYVFYKVRRGIALEKNKLLALKELGLDIRQGRCVLPKAKALDWLHQHHDQLVQLGFWVLQNQDDPKRYFLGYSSINISFQENRDWFDIYAKVIFGEYEIPFVQLKSLILNRKREFTLPNGEVAVIPEVWFSKYSELFAFAEYDPEMQHLFLKKHHLALVHDLTEESLAVTVMNRKLDTLLNFSQIESYPLPSGFSGVLRPYQKAGYDWINFLNQYRFGGCLADDMGLGKTVTTLAMLQFQKEQGVREPTLLVMPTSLLYNWELEARRFTPQLRVFVYTGTYRIKDTAQFDDYDLILTSYGIVRLDVELLKNYRFNYVILDEAQIIKNPTSHITKAVGLLNARHRLILTGTPLENTTLDLWSQMTFVNPGLLGNQSFFRSQFQVPIEKHNDETKIQKLYTLIKPFLLRRHKSQVARDLPPKVESMHYCTMTEAQEKKYEEAKSYYRNYILEHIEKQGVAKSQIVLLQGLTKLRQLANHPQMLDPAYEGDSGKLEEVVSKLDTILAGDHKVLIFSQFIRHLNIVKGYLENQKIPFRYLDGSTQNRQEQVQEFQENADVRVFLISLKAGGLGLNLTAADYVFILDPWWNPAIEAQAIDRAHRIGQQKTVFSYKFITQNTVEEKILALQRNKQRLFNELITTEESFVKSLSKDDIMALLS